MKANKIIKAAETMNATQFLEFLYENKVFFSILDQDNIMDPNDGYLNVEVDGMPEGESILFTDGEYC